MSTPIPAWLKNLCESAAEDKDWPDERYPEVAFRAVDSVDDCRGSDAQVCLAQTLIDRVERLQAELAVHLAAEFRRFACNIGASRGGWSDTMGVRAAQNIGDRLVEFGLWERKPDERGPRQYYRLVSPRVADTMGD